MKIKVKVGDVVVLSSLPDATRYDVLSVDGAEIKVREAGTDYVSYLIWESMIHAKELNNEN